MFNCERTGDNEGDLLGRDERGSSLWQKITLVELSSMVRMEGLEPSRIAPYASETYAYTNSATSAYFHCHFVLMYHWLILPNRSAGVSRRISPTPLTLLVAKKVCRGEKRKIAGSSLAKISWNFI